jgi:NAD(P)-dependent dehydrogenase (short-subunit alcohol dehydrogenase family)
MADPHAPVSTDKILQGSIALVTGASRGIGAAAAIGLARCGAHVVIAARDDAGLAATDDAIRAIGGEATLLPADLTRGDVADQVGASLYERFGRLDTLVHAAGMTGTPSATAEIDQAEWDRAFGINVTASWRLIRGCDALLRAAPYGRVVALIHPDAAAPAAYRALASASMAARRNLILSWAAELRRTRLRVNLLEPATDDAERIGRILVDLCLPSETRHGAVVIGH